MPNLFPFVLNHWNVSDFELFLSSLFNHFDKTLLWTFHRHSNSFLFKLKAIRNLDCHLDGKRNQHFLKEKKTLLLTCWCYCIQSKLRNAQRSSCPLTVDEEEDLFRFYLLSTPTKGLIYYCCLVKATASIHKAFSMYRIGVSCQ